MTAIVLRRFFCLLALSLFAMGTATAQTATSQTATTQGDSFTLNLKDADITTLIATVSEVTGRNFVVDPRVKGDVTVLSTEPMTPSQLYETFLSVLEVHGFAAVPSGEVTKIIPQINAKQDGGFGRR
ncbi:MAG: type II secretion system protein GspD, partial [Salinisphaera sp.]|nr:type II secretion system protein GspD [Salinisphaera sp.]